MRHIVQAISMSVQKGNAPSIMDALGTQRKLDEENSSTPEGVLFVRPNVPGSGISLQKYYCQFYITIHSFKIQITASVQQQSQSSVVNICSVINESFYFIFPLYQILYKKIAAEALYSKLRNEKVD